MECDSMLDVEKIKTHGMTDDSYREFLANMANIIISDMNVISTGTVSEIIANRRLLFDVVKELHNAKGDIYAGRTLENSYQQEVNRQVDENRQDGGSTYSAMPYMQG